MTRRFLLVVGLALATVFAVVLAALAAPAGAQPTAPPVQDCDTARTEFDRALKALEDRADELGIGQRDTDRLREDIETSAEDGLIDDGETAALLRDPAVVRVEAEFNADDIDLIKRFATAHVNLLRCDDGDDDNARDDDNNNDDNEDEDVDEDEDEGEAPVGGIDTGHGGMSHVVA